MAFTNNELKELANEISKAIKQGFSEIPKTDGMGRNIGDPSGPGYDANARADYIKKLLEQNKNDEIAKIEKQLEDIRNGGKAGTISGKRAIKQLENQRKDLNSGKNFIDSANKQLFNKISGTFDKIGNVISSISQIATSVSDGILAHRKSQLKEGKNIFEKTQKAFQANLEMSNIVASNIVTTITSFTSQTATEAAQSLMSGAKEEANARIKLFTSLQMAEREFNVAESERKIEEEKGITAAASGTLKGVSGLVSLLGPVGMVIGGIINGLTAAGEAVQQTRLSWKEFDVEKMQQFNAVYNDMLERTKAIADKFKNFTDGLDTAANQINNYVRQTDNVYKNTGLMFGWAGDKFSSIMRETAITTAEIFGTTAEEMKTMQESFINTSSRAIMLNGNEYNQMTAISKTFGVSQGDVANIMGTMNLFNVSIDQGYEKFDAMYHIITKMGLSTSKFAKDLNNNLKLAQKYNFKGGVDNMMKLTKWAQQTRFNLNNAASFADSIMNDSLSGALEKSARLQVLGGSAAMYSDPLGMLYDAGADVGDMAKRMTSMFGDITGTFNKKTGETDFSWYENRMIAERAKALGMDVGDAKNMIRQNKKQGVINGILKGSGLDEEDRLAIGNRAQYKNGNWVVNTRAGEKTIQELADLGKKEREEILLPENQEEAIMQIAENTRSMLETEKANLAVNQAIAGVKVYSTAKAASDKNIESQNLLYSSPEYINQMKKSIAETAEIASIQANKTKELVEQYGSLIESYRKFVRDQIREGYIFSETEQKQIDELANHGFNKVEKRALDVATATVNTELNDDERAKAINDAINQDDGYGSTNGGVILGASKVKSISDGAVNVKTSNRDQYLAAETGGPIDILLKQILPGLQMLINGNGSSNGNVNLNLNGKLELSQNGSSVNLVDMIKNDPATATKFLAVLQKTMEVNQNGKSVTNHKIS